LEHAGTTSTAYASPALNSARVSISSTHAAIVPSIYVDKSAAQNYPLKDVLKKHNKNGVRNFLQTQMVDS
jgi:hypothetical protein